eukprot:5233049-Amphidinium_carterae.1
MIVCQFRNKEAVVLSLASWKRDVVLNRKADPNLSSTSRSTHDDRMRQNICPLAALVPRQHNLHPVATSSKLFWPTNVLVANCLTGLGCLSKLVTCCMSFYQSVQAMMIEYHDKGNPAVDQEVLNRDLMFDVSKAH